VLCTQHCQGASAGPCSLKGLWLASSMLGRPMPLPNCRDIFTETLTTSCAPVEFLLVNLNRALPQWSPDAEQR
jgi:hypothetical protein